MCFCVNIIGENVYVVVRTYVHKYYLCIKFDIVLKIYMFCFISFHPSRTHFNDGK